MPAEYTQPKTYADYLTARFPEKIFAISVGQHPCVPEDLWGEAMEWHHALPFLSKIKWKNDDRAVPPVYVWGEAFVGFMCEYDGSVQLKTVAKEPLKIMPMFK